MKNIESKIQLCVSKYKDLQNIKLVANATGIKWQTVYWYLKKANIEVTGNKAIYGSSKDRFAHKGEAYIEAILPNAINQNHLKFQPKVDFLINDISLEIKSSRLDSKLKRWCFSLKKQNHIADYFILLAYCENTEKIIHRFMIPRDMVRKGITTISIVKNLEASKWRDFLIEEEDLIEFFVKTIAN